MRGDGEFPDPFVGRQFEQDGNGLSTLAAWFGVRFSYLVN